MPSAYIVCIDDLVISPAWSRQAAREQLGGEPIELPGDHSPFSSQPVLLAETLARLAA